mgnify:CR=1 FL=1
MKFYEADTEEPEINLTALIDVVFLLLIFFMVSTTFDQTRHFDVSLPASDSAATIDQKMQSAVVLMVDGRVGIGDWTGRLDDRLALQDQLQQTFMSSTDGSGTDQGVVIYADEEVSHGQVVTLMSVMAAAGVESVQVATRYNQP